MKCGRVKWQEAEETRKDKKSFQYCSDPSRQEILYLWAVQGLSGLNSIEPTLQDNVLIPNNFFEYICHIGCAVSLHSTTNSGLIAGGQNSSRERQTVFFTAVNHVRQELDLTKTTSCIVQAKVEKAHRDTVCWGRHTAFLSTEKDWSSIKQDRTQSSSTIHSQLIVSRK